METIGVLAYGDAGYGDEMLRGAAVAAALALCAFLVTLPIGAALAAMKLSRLRPARVFAGAYTTVFRGVPELLVIYLIFFGSGPLLAGVANVLFGYDGYVSLPQFATGVLCIAVISGAYCCEALRGAALAVPKGQREAAVALGLSRWHTLRFVLLQQILRIALPSLGNVWLHTLKETALISVIGVAEIMRQAHLAAGATRQPFTFYLVGAGLFFVLSLLSQVGIRRIRIWADRGIGAA